MRKIASTKKPGLFFRFIVIPCHWGGRASLNTGTGA